MLLPPPKPIADKIQKIQMLIDAENMFFFQNDIKPSFNNDAPDSYTICSV